MYKVYSNVMFLLCRIDRIILISLVVVTMPLHLFVLEALASMGYTRSEIEDSLGQAKYDDVFATYLLLGRKTTDVSTEGESIYRKYA